MSVGRICTRSVSVATPEESVASAASRMAEHGVGTVVVVDEGMHPAGLLTDRDVVLRVVARQRDPATTRVGDVMSAPAVSVGEGAPIEDGLRLMAGAAARRLAVTDAEGRLVGVLSLDDVLELLAEEAQTIGRLLRA